jgi:hypothetical protein
VKTPESMRPSEFLAHIAGLRQAVLDGLEAGDALAALDDRIAAALLPLEGKVVYVSIDYVGRHFLVEGGCLSPYEAPEIIYAHELDRPEVVAVSGRGEPLRLHDIESEVA